MIDAAKHFGTLVGFAALGIVLILLAWQGNIGKGLACFVSPATLEVIGGSGDQSAQADQTSDSTTHHSGSADPT